MSNKKGEIARCGACRFYTPIGRRGGNCSQLGVPVQSVWKTCYLAKSPFQQLAHDEHSEVELTKIVTEIATEKKLVPQALPMTSGQFLSAEKQLVAKLSE